MSDQDEPSDGAREGAAEEKSQPERDDEASPSKSGAAPAGERRKSSAARTGRSSKSGSGKDGARGKASKSQAPAGPLALAGVVALAVGGAAGWFGHEAHAKSQLRGEAAEGSGSCGAWEQAICSKRGKQSAACQKAKGATPLLTSSVCDAALETVPASISKMKAARASCDKLQNKLCNDLSKGSPACKLVKDQTPGFPPSRCDKMLKQYDQVLGQLKMMEKRMGQGGMQGPAMGGSRPGAAPPGAAPPSHGSMPSRKALPSRKTLPTKKAAPTQ